MEFFIDWLRIQPVRRSGKELWSPSDKVKTSVPRAFGQIITPHNSSVYNSSLVYNSVYSNSAVYPQFISRSQLFFSQSFIVFPKVS